MKRPNIEDLRFFSKVAETSSFTKAAKLLGEPKVKVSRRVASLEGEMKLQLFYRTTRQTQMTQAGKELYQKIHGPLESLEKAVDDIGRLAVEISGEVRITGPEDVGPSLLSPIVNQIAEEFPKLKLELILTSQVVDLVRDSVDVALRFGSVKDNSLKVRRLGQFSTIFVCSPRYLELSAPLKSPDDLKNHRCLIFKPGDSTQWRVCNQGKSRVVSTNPFITANNSFAIKSAALEHRGIALLADFDVKQSIYRGELVQVLKGWQTPAVSAHIVTPPRRVQVPSVKLVADIIYKKLKPLFS